MRLRLNFQNSYWIKRKSSINKASYVNFDLGNMIVTKELFTFLKVRKKLWLAPIILVMIILGGLSMAQAQLLRHLFTVILKEYSNEHFGHIGLLCIIALLIY